ncbi:MAG: hypothetical protein E7161_01985 [Firmicutes bacterium]|nr:hypothetical protein [Bacillota bacterium]
MFNIIERYILRMTKEDINNFAISKNIQLSEGELNFTYDFVKKNYRTFLGNPKLFNIERYQNNYSKENFSKITKVYNEYIQRYANYL